MPPNPPLENCGSPSVSNRQGLELGAPAQTESEANPAARPLATAPRRILVIKLRQFGDVLLSTPVFSALKQQFPGAEIHVAVNFGTGAILEGNPAVAGLLQAPKPGLAPGPRRWSAECRHLLAVRRHGFDLAIDLTTSDRSALLARFSGAQRRFGFCSFKGFAGRRHFYTDLVQPRREEHIVLKHARLLRAMGIEDASPSLVFPVNEAERSVVRQFLPAGSQYFQVHPISRIEKKNWPVRHLAEAVEHLARRGWMPVVTGSSDPWERKQIDEFLSLLNAPALDLSGQLTIKQLGALSERAACFFGVDTAPMHIAAAVGAPVIALFGPSSERLWAPWCERRLILSRDLPCRLPCKNKHHCEHIECLRGLTPGMVLPQIDRFLDGLSQREPRG